MKKLVLGTLAATMLLGNVAQASEAAWNARMHSPSMMGAYNDVYGMTYGEIEDHVRISNSIYKFADALDDCLAGGVGETKEIIKKHVKDVRTLGLKQKAAGNELIKRLNVEMEDNCGWTMAVTGKSEGWHKVDRPPYK